MYILLKHGGFLNFKTSFAIYILFSQCRKVLCDGNSALAMVGQVSLGTIALEFS